MQSAVIVEDEMLARERLKVLLNDSQVMLLAEFDYAEPALEWFKIHQADIVFVDIGLPEVNGLAFVEALKRTAKHIPSIIFTTASEEHALKAFELAATDYLLKPIKLSRLQEALKRIPSYQNTAFESFTVQSRQKIVTIPWQQARYLKADHKYVVLVTAGGHEFLLDKTLIHWEEVLGDKVLRLHRSALVFKHALDCLVKQETSEHNIEQWGAKLVDLEEILPISRRQLSALRKQLSL